MKRLCNGVLALSKSFLYAFAGIWYACRSQQNFRIHLICTLWVLHLGQTLSFSVQETALLVLCCGGMLALELLNTALEATVDLFCGTKRHHLAKIAKDASAGAVLLFAFCSLCTAFLLLIPSGKWRFLLAYIQELSPLRLLFYVSAAALSFFFIFFCGGVPKS